MVDVEVFGAGAGALAEAEVRRLCELTAATRGVDRGHVAVEFVAADRIAELNERHRGKSEPTDVLSFPIDGIERHAGAQPGEPLELGDVIVCPAHTIDLREAVVHGMLHLLGMDHERDNGEMLALQRDVLAAADQ